MKEKKEISTVKAAIYVLILYTIFTSIFGVVLYGVSYIVGNLLFGVIGNIIYVVLSILAMYASWELSVICVFKKATVQGLNRKLLVRIFMIVIAVFGIISMFTDLYTHSKEINERYSKDFLEKKEVIAEFSQEEIQARADEIDAEAEQVKINMYTSIVAQNLIGIALNLIIISMVPKARLEKYDGVAQMEKDVMR